MHVCRLFVHIDSRKKGRGGNVHQTLLIESAAQGVLFVNGQFCGPMEPEGQSFPVGKNAEVYIQLFPLGEGAPLTAALQLREGIIERLAPQESVFALCWPDGIIQLELRMQEQAEPPGKQMQTAAGTLARYLTLRLAGDPQAARLWLRPQDEARAVDLSAYSAVVPLRFAPPSAPERFDDRAGLARAIQPNVAVIDTALAVTVPAGQGRRMIQQMQILAT